MPIIYYQIQTMQACLQAHRQQRIALVPTMGNLHDGHLALVTQAKQHADIVVVSIFVNPTQFGEGEDFDSYPRTLDEDVAKLATVGVDYVFAPSVSEMYPVLPPPTSVYAGAISQQLCGQTRAGHFDGVGIVVSKLFNIIQPDVAVFGQKDYQQLAIIKQLVRDLSYPIEIIAAPIVRASDGLALSSRNQYLSPEERQMAPKLQASLQQLAMQLQGQALTKAALDSHIAKTIASLTKAGFVVDYLAVQTQQLRPVFSETEHEVPQDSDIVIVAAAWLGRARLLDNLMLSVT